jgi:hypothetical protein
MWCKLTAGALCIGLIVSVIPIAESAKAQEFNFRVPRIIPNVLRAPKRVVIAPRLMLRRTLGAVAVGIVGVAILSSLTKSQRSEVARRTVRVIERDPDQVVVDSYMFDNGRKKVKVTASPSQPASTFRDDPELKIASNEAQEQPPQPGRRDEPQGAGPSDPAMAQAIPEGTGAASASKSERSARGDSETPSIKLSDLPDSTNCRKIATQLTTSKKNGSENPARTTTTALVCKMPDGEWKPVVL